MGLLFSSTRAVATYTMTVSMTRIGVNFVDVLNSMLSLFKPQCSLNAAAELQKVVVMQRSSRDSLVEHEYSEDEQISTGYVRHNS